MASCRGVSGCCQDIPQQPASQQKHGFPDCCLLRERPEIIEPPPDNRLVTCQAHMIPGFDENGRVRDQADAEESEATWS